VWGAAPPVTNNKTPTRLQYTMRFTSAFLQLD
jgi:hypothetical protein